MTSVADKNRRHKAKTTAKARAPKAEPRPAYKRSASVERIEDRDGLEWLWRKKRMTQRQFRAAMAYRLVFREPGAGALKSFLDDPFAGGGGGSGNPPDLNAASYDAQRKLTEYRAVLSFGAGMVLMMDGIAGVGSSPQAMSGGNTKRGIENLITFLHACDRLAEHCDTQAALAAAKAQDAGGGKRHDAAA